MARRRWYPAFLKVLCVRGNVTLAAKAANIQRVTAYAARARDSDFARKWDEALEEYADLLELRAHNLAVDGLDEPVYHQGKVVGHVKRYSVPMLQFLMKAARPDVYREKVGIEHSGEVRTYGERKVTIELVKADPAVAGDDAKVIEHKPNGGALEGP